MQHYFIPERNITMYAKGITLLQHNNYLELTRDLYVQTYFINTTKLFNRINSKRIPFHSFTLRHPRFTSTYFKVNMM